MTAVEVYQHGGALAAQDEWTRERIELIKRTYCKGATDDELALFVATAQRTGLSPEARQIFAVMRADKKAGRDVMTIQTSIDGYRLIAQRSKDYAGQIPKQWCGSDGVWVDVWLKPEHPMAAKAGVYRRGFAEPLVAVATWAEYAQTYRDGNAMGLWASMPALMLAKCAESLALRSAFPAELSGLYTQDEMGQAEPAPAAQRRAGGEPGSATAAPARANTPRPGPRQAVDVATGEVVESGGAPSTGTRKRRPPTVADKPLTPDTDVSVVAAEVVEEQDPPPSQQQVADIRRRLERLTGQDRAVVRAAWPERVGQAFLHDGEVHPDFSAVHAAKALALLEEFSGVQATDEPAPTLDAS